MLFRSEMQQPDIALHTFEVAPKTLDRVDAREGRHTHPRHKLEGTPHDERRIGAVLRVAQHQNKPTQEHEFNKDAKYKVLARNVGEEHIAGKPAGRDDKWHERY